MFLATSLGMQDIAAEEVDNGFGESIGNVGEESVRIDNAVIGQGQVQIAG